MLRSTEKLELHVSICLVKHVFVAEKPRRSHDCGEGQKPVCACTLYSEHHRGHSISRYPRQLKQISSMAGSDQVKTAQPQEGYHFP